MAAGKQSIIMKMVNIEYEGKKYQVNVEEELLSRLNSPDLKVREGATEQLVQTVRDIAHASSSSASTSSTSTPPVTELTSPSNDDDQPAKLPPDNQSSNSLSPKIWRESEAELLLDIRLEMDQLFQGSTNHKTLWNKIAEKMLLKDIHATGEQCNNKFKAMKRDYRTTKDHNEQSGNNKRTCRFYEKFDEMYGCKAGTKPTATLASFGSDDQDDQSTVNLNKRKRKVRTRPPAASPSSEYFERMEKRGILDLPEEIVAEILSYLSAEDCSQLILVNRHFQKIVYRKKKTLCVEQQYLEVNTLVALQNLTSLKILDDFNEEYQNHNCVLRHYATVAKICQAIELGALQHLCKI